jgi:FkbM family methyltransferase
MNLSGVSNKTIVGKALRLPLTCIPKNIPMPILQGPLRGKRWLAGSCTHGCWLGSYEYEKQKLFAAALRPGDVVYDLGANVGFYSLLASVLVGSEGRVYSFEPVPANLSFLRRHLELNKVQNCSVFSVAASHSSGTATFHLGRNNLVGHLTTKPQLGTLSVRTVALDDLVSCGQLRPPNVIKCDIEGGEYDALTGASEILRTYSPVVFLATHGAEVTEWCCKLLTDLDYQLTPLDKLPLSMTREILAVGAKAAKAKARLV